MKILGKFSARMMSITDIFSFQRIYSYHFSSTVIFFFSCTFPPMTYYSPSPPPPRMCLHHQNSCPQPLACPLHPRQEGSPYKCSRHEKIQSNKNRTELFFRSGRTLTNTAYLQYMALPWALHRSTSINPWPLRAMRIHNNGDHCSLRCYVT
jgi:hypothetical protein